MTWVSEPYQDRRTATHANTQALLAALKSACVRFTLYDLSSLCVRLLQFSAGFCLASPSPCQAPEGNGFHTASNQELSQKHTVEGFEVRSIGWSFVSFSSLVRLATFWDSLHILFLVNIS